MRSFDEDTRYFKELSKLKVKCKRCGHTQTLFKDKVICDWCKYYIYKDKKLEFVERLKQELKNEELLWKTVNE